MEKTIPELVRELEQNYIGGKPTKLGKYVEFDQYENIEKINAYINSKHVSGPVDSKGRDKPFFNIVNAVVNIWYRATSGKLSIHVQATKSSDILGSFLATIKLQEWIKKERVMVFIKQWGRTLAKYGSAVVKFVDLGDKLVPSVVQWNHLISDAIDFKNNPKIEKLYFTPSQLKANVAYDKETVQALIDAQSTRKDLEGNTMDNLPNYIEVYEVHGVFPLSNITEKPEDDDKYEQQMHVVSFVGQGNGEYADFTLYRGREEKDPYMITHLIEEQDRAQSIGAVEYLFESQWMVNHESKAIKDQLDLVSKIVYQTADDTFVGRNILTELDNGDVLTHAANEPITQVNNSTDDYSSLQAFANEWRLNGQELTSTPDAVRGNTQKSGTAYRTQQLVTTQASSLFAEMVESKELAIQDMMTEYILPFLKRQFDTTEEISDILDDYQIKKIDAMYVPREVRKRVNQNIKENMFAKLRKDLDGDMTGLTRGDVFQQMQSEQEQLTQSLKEMGNQRFITPSEMEDIKWKDVFKDLEWGLGVKIDRRDDETVLTTLNTIFQNLVNPATSQFITTPKGKLLFNKILSIAGAVSPIELSDVDQIEVSQTAPQSVAQPIPELVT